MQSARVCASRWQLAWPPYSSGFYSLCVWKPVYTTAAAIQEAQHAGLRRRF